MLLLVATVDTSRPVIMVPRLADPLEDMVDMAVALVVLLHHRARRPELILSTCHCLVPLSTMLKPIAR